MRVIGLTGGVASGKSTVARILCELAPALTFFDADESVRAMLQGDAEVMAEITERFGTAVLRRDGSIDRAKLRSSIFHSESAKRDLEAIIHPRVREECLESLRLAANLGSSLFLADIPLLFENGFNFGQHLTLVVAVGRETQFRRLSERSGFDSTLTQSILSSQMATEEKLQRADVVLWNEGPIAASRAQCLTFLQCYANMSDDTNTSTETESTDSNDDRKAAAVAKPPPPAIDINEFRLQPLGDLYAMADALPGKLPPTLTKAQLIFELLSFQAREGAELICEGVVEQAKENYAMLRDPARSFRTSPDDIHLGGNLLRDYGIRPGQKLKIKARSPRERDKFLSAVEILEIEGQPASEFVAGKEFEKLTPLFPDHRLLLEGEGPGFFSPRVIDLVAPLGKGQRGLIVAPPRGGKTILLKQIAKAIYANHPEVELIVVLLDERPEEVTDFEETVGATVFASTFDETAKRHSQVADLVIERARRLVEQKKDVVLLLDSLTRLARGHNTAMQGGPIGSGGISPGALAKSRKFFGNARNVEEGGSLTILATALIETESRMDDVIFEEFKGTGNMEVRLDRELAERRIYPAIHIPQSGTRNDERLYHPDEFAKVLEVRKQLAQVPVGEAVELLMKNVSATKSNTELLLRGLR